MSEHQRQEIGRWGSLCLDVAPPLAGEEIKWSLGGRERDNPAASSD